MLAKVKSQKVASQKAKGIGYSAKNKRGAFLSGKYSNLADNLNRRGGGILQDELLRKPEDIRDDTKYMGQTEVMLTNVPMYTENERTPVDEETVREWILYGISEEDPLSQDYFDEIQMLTEKIGEVEMKLKKIPKIEFTDENGGPMPEELAKEERNKLFTTYGNERAVLEQQLEDVERGLQEHLKRRKTMTINLVRGEIDQNTHTCIWHMKLSGTEDCYEIEDLLLLKENWSGIRLGAGRIDVVDGNRIPPWAGRDIPPDGSNLLLPDYSDYHVNMVGVLLKRVPKGVGLFQQLDRKTSSIVGPAFDFYYGQYESGLKHGQGVEINDTGVYAGEYVQGQRHGKGRWDLADGTTVVGQFGIQIHNNLSTKKFVNPYLEGEPHGDVEIYYGDGGYFKGHMINGVITGNGDYQSAFNEILSGPFEHGMLHGNHGFHQTTAEDVYLGRFRQGEMHGYGSYVQAEGDCYEGYFEHGLRHGRGIQSYPEVGIYRGYFVNGFKQGRGTLEYGLLEEADDDDDDDDDDEDIQSSSKQQQGKKRKSKSSKYRDPLISNSDHSLSPFEYLFQGYFMANSITNQGSLIQTRLQIPRIVSRLDKRGTYRLNQVLKREIRIQKQSDRIIEKYVDMETFIRQEMLEKKQRIYGQQKHYTKKTMYNVDVYEQFNERELKNKLFLREERLRRVKEDKYPYQKALIPRLRHVHNHIVNTYTKEYEDIRPNPRSLRSEEMIPDELVKVSLANMEEARERQRLLKYDMIWQRAEEAYISAQRSSV
jgi:hypothetical protein